ncbi:hypothetical protein [Streptomyces violascens]|uniref:hypothetical protein n=1 Tax=Streptomyces violascens TaxID=67381 RepID=UPI0036C0AD6E
MSERKHLIDLLAFVAVLVTVIALLLIGVAPESLAIVVVAMAGLYGAWLGTGSPRGQGGRKQQR